MADDGAGEEIMVMNSYTNDEVLQHLRTPRLPGATAGMKMAWWEKGGMKYVKSCHCSERFAHSPEESVGVFCWLAVAVWLPFAYRLVLLGVNRRVGRTYEAV